MPLITSTTLLNKYKFGVGPNYDERGGGNSNQPYIKRDIPGVQYNNPNQTFESVMEGDLPVRSGPDFLIRNGFLAPLDAARDVSRLAQMFVDTRSPNGLLFIAKENVLSRTANKTQASVGIGYGGATDLYLENTPTGVRMGGGANVNAGIYTPLSTLGQALGGFAGAHLNLLGLDPTSPVSGVVEGGLFPGAGLTTYESVVGQEKTLNINPNSPDGGPNRLVNLKYFIDEDGTTPKVNLLEYAGGPGAVLGIGNTNIKFADQRTGAANKNGMGIINNTYQVGQNNRSTNEAITGSFTFDYRGRGVSNATSQYVFLNPSVDPNKAFLSNGLPAIELGPNGPYQTFKTSVNSIIIGEEGQTLQTNNEILYANNSITYNQKQLTEKDNVIEGGQSSLYPTDFRKELYTYPNSGSAPTDNPSNPTTGGTQTSTVLSLSPSYRNKNKDVRLNQGQPGKTGGQLRDTNNGGKNVWNYGIAATELEALDKITAMPMYSGVGPDVNQPINDLVKFRIAAINNNKSNGEAVYMHFRAFLDGFSDAYTSTWNPVNYVGRGDTLYNYGGFGRTISMGFTVAAQSKAELIPMYKKLNYLASTLAPDYTESGFMRGNLVRLTVGGYLYEQPGFITSLTYDVPQESSWEIALNAEGGSDKSVKELPHMIKVSGFAFTPIHTFLPQKPNNANFPTERYIALSNGVNSNYNDVYETYQPNAASGGDGDNNLST